MSSYNLWTNGVSDVDRVARLFNKFTRARDPLSGIVDGANQYFYTNYTPLLSSGSVGIYTSGSAPLANTEYTVDYDAGLITFNTAPSVQPSATYQTARFSDYIIKSILVAGFDEMEGLWYRGFALSSVVGNQVYPITEDSAAAYVTTSSGSDPQINSIYFADSRVQINLYVKCVQLAYYRTMMGEMAQTHFIYREAQGAHIDKSMTTKNLKMAYDAVEKTLNKAREQAQYEYYGSGAYGAMIYSPMTGDFIAHKFWQQQSINQDYRNTMTYRGDRW